MGREETMMVDGMMLFFFIARLVVPPLCVAIIYECVCVCT